MLTDALKDAIRDGRQRVAQQWPNFKARRGQQQMIADVARTLAGEHEHIALIEGPTGSGKSIAYLLGAGPVAIERELPLVIATGTIALQQQLIERDLPQLLRYTGWDLELRLAKGRGRYVCLRELARLSTKDPSQGDLGFDADAGDPVWRRAPSAPDLATIAKMSDAITANTWEGDLDRWPERVSPIVAEHVTVGRHGCSGPVCPFFNACAVRRHRARLLEGGGIVVANHALLLTEWSAQQGPFANPSRYLLVVDEAHHVPSAAVEHAARTVPLDRTVAQLPRDAVRLHGLAAALGAELAPQSVKDAIANDYNRVAREIASVAQKLLPYRAQLQPERAQRMDDALLDTLGHDVQSVADAVASLLERVTDLRTAALDAGKQGRIPPVLSDRITQNIARPLDELNRLHDAFDLLAAPAPADARTAPVARWMTLVDGGGKPELVLGAACVSAADWLAQRVWSQTPGAVLTSATLTALGHFGALRSGLGLSARFDVLERALPHAFDLEAQAQLHVPAMDTDPKQPEAHTEELASRLPHWVQDGPAGGRLVLCTSRRQLNALRESLRAWPAIDAGVKVQGEAPLSDLLAAHARDLEAGGISVLMGLASFAEGLDLPGALCTRVIVAKLPFAAPDDPIEAERARWLEGQGRSYFSEVAVPQAYLRLAQAMGRLIRSETDCGDVILADRRVVTTTYGRRVLASLPPYTRCIEPAAKDARSTALSNPVHAGPRAKVASNREIAHD